MPSSFKNLILHSATVGTGVKTRITFFLKCPKYINQRTILIRGLSDNLGAGFTDLPEKEKLLIILHGQSSNAEKHCAVAREVFKFLETSKRFL